MSLDSQTLFDRGPASVDEEELVTRLSAHMPPALEVVVERYRHTWTPQEWSVFDGPKHGSDRQVYGPGGFVVCFHPKIVSVYHMLSFLRTFRLGGESRDQLRAAYFCLGDFFDSTELLYTNELAPWSGDTLDEAARSLQSEYGRPAYSLDDLSRGEEFGEGGWFRERIDPRVRSI